MKKFTLLFLIAFLTLLIGFIACSKPGTDPDSSGGHDPAPNGEQTGIGKGEPGIVGLSGIEAWDKLASTEKNRIKGWNTLFMHQSVGGDLEDGAEVNGFKFEYFDLTSAPKGLSGNVFSVSNGDPIGKMAEFKKNVIAHQASVKIAIFKFGYADINDTNKEEVKAAYKKMIEELRTQVTGIRFVHITPPLIYIVTRDDGNAAKMNVAQWMKDTFKGTDVIYELEEIESNNGGCKLGNVLTICDENRSTAACSSKNQGVDASEGQGHLCEKAAARISKAFLMSIYNAGK
jgi:hypothetical protein